MERQPSRGVNLQLKTVQVAPKALYKLLETSSGFRLGLLYKLRAPRDYQSTMDLFWEFLALALFAVVECLWCVNDNGN